MKIRIVILQILVQQNKVKIIKHNYLFCSFKNKINKDCNLKYLEIDLLTLKLNRIKMLFKNKNRQIKK